MTVEKALKMLENFKKLLLEDLKAADTIEIETSAVNSVFNGMTKLNRTQAEIIQKIIDELKETKKKKQKEDKIMEPHMKTNERSNRFYACGDCYAILMQFAFENPKVAKGLGLPSQMTAVPLDEPENILCERCEKKEAKGFFPMGKSGVGL